MFLRITILVITLLFFSPCFGQENVFYILHYKNNSKETQKIFDNVSHHIHSNNILISQAYNIKPDGTVSGFIDPNLLDFAKKNQIKFMALVTTSVFDADVSHKFLTNPKAQEKAIQSILDLCKQNSLYGVQFDIEMVYLKDKTLLTYFFQNAAKILHDNHFVVSIAIPPVVSDGPFISGYQKRLYDNWSGAFDLKKIGEISDFVTLMTYDQHFGRVAPGAIAGQQWMEAVIKHTLKFIPANKISLGIPSYSRFWYTGKDGTGQIRLQTQTLSYEDALKIIGKNHAPIMWDDRAKVHFTFYEHNWLNEYIFLEDSASFKNKLNLVTKYHLRGFSLFRIGTEDPKIWNISNNH